jgi:hypothetical protein
MNRFFFLIVILGIASGAATLGGLAGEFDLIVQKMGIFHTEDVGLEGCTCIDDSTGLPTSCGPIVTNDPLCIPTP